MTDSKINDLYVIRGYNESDRNFILATFLRGLYYGNEFYKLIPKDIFMNEYKKVPETLLIHPNVFISVACLKDEPDVILGYAVMSSDFDTIHWVFVKSVWRKQGIMRRLIPRFPQSFTHFTTLWLKLLPKFGDCVFNPFKV